MLNAIIRFSLQNRLLVATLAVLVLIYGGWQILQLPIDVFPDLNRPRVVVMTESPGLAPEEVETLVTFPLETLLNGASGVQEVRSVSGVGISVIYVEFDWGTDIYTDRQIVTERLAVADQELPPGIRPQLAPISSIMGQIMVVGMRVDPSRIHQASSAGASAPIELQSGDDATADVQRTATSSMELRTLADWVVRQQLLTIPGVSQVFVMGGERKQFQVLVDPTLLLKFGVSLQEVEQAVRDGNQNSTGGYLDEQGPSELLVRALGRIRTIEDLESTVVKHIAGRSVLLRQVARVVEGPQVKRGDSAIAVRSVSGYVSSAQSQDANSSRLTLDTGPSTGGAPASHPAVVLTVTKQPGADTREVTDQITAALDRLAGRLPSDVVIFPSLYQQKDFIDRAIENVLEALRDGGILVVLILFIFLLNFRTTFITLTAIPLSIVITGLVFKALGLSINTMTLGGLAVAIGELVDDAIVDVENIFRRLRENRHLANPRPVLLVVYQASVEVRNSIVYGTIIVVLVFIPLFALSGMEGRLFTPLGIAYIVSILSSLLVSLTVTPVLSYWLLGGRQAAPRQPSGEPAGDPGDRPSDVTVHSHSAAPSPVTRVLQGVAERAIRVGLAKPSIVLTAACAAVVVSGLALAQLENDFLPPFDEGAVQINVLMPPGTSLRKSNEIGTIVEQRLLEIDEVEALVRRTGRAELDEHAEGVHVSEIVTSISPDSGRGRAEILDDIRERLADVPGIVTSVEQPLAHLISHMLSGVKAQIAIKLFGDDLDVLRRTAREIQNAMVDIEGVTDLQVEQQITIPQLRIEIDGHALQQFGLSRADVTELIETAMNGVVVSEVLQSQRKFDLLVRLDEPYREDLESLKRLAVHLPTGGVTRLESVARIYRGGGPNTINREQVRRRIVIQANVAGRGLVDVVSDIRRAIAPLEEALPTGYFVQYGGQFESQQSASRTIGVLMVAALIAMFLVLYKMFRSANLALQVMVALPMALIGSVAALYITGQTLTIAAMVGFISLCGIASRNGILLINHYLHLVRYEGEQWTAEMIVRAGRERLAPVLMTALTSGIGLVPLALAAGEPGKEILYPIATVIIGGLITSTTLEFLVRPALFERFGMNAARRVMELERQDVRLTDKE